ncbi:Monothiol glutaredoxin-7 [Sphaceloma murrayae]|uniref:Monothiol glutaredoxin-7 n=1 Tax=Sphaceloma murrayae TaxID=2082308 RepID=A0A2K1QY80_9PEZI|nr:Monothiol glutaredoxin-7 [Sphaceloma murrayae]
MVRSPSRSRFRPFLILALIILTVIYLTTGSRSTQTSEFYTRTAKVRDGEGEIVLPKVKEHGGGKGETVSKEKGQKVLADDDDEEMVEKAKEKAKEVADEVGAGSKKKSSKGKKVEEEHDADAVHGPKDKGQSRTGRKKVQGKGDGHDGVAKVGNTEKHVKDKSKGADKEEVTDHEAEVVLDGILKKSPIIIFSKSYCPYSMKAKRILLQGYKIVPAPHVEELDEHAMGDRLQTALNKMTGRRTVPNVLINGKSIGGGDDIEELDEADKLAKKILSLGGKRIMEVNKLQRKEDSSS